MRGIKHQKITHISICIYPKDMGRFVHVSRLSLMAGWRNHLCMILTFIMSQSFSLFTHSPMSSLQCGGSPMQRHRSETRGNPGGQAVRKHRYRFHNVHAATPVQAFCADALFDLRVYPTTTENIARLSDMSSRM